MTPRSLQYIESMHELLASHITPEEVDKAVDIMIDQYFANQSR